MHKTLMDVAQKLKDANKKVQLIYAFNGIGKTRLSRAFKTLIASKDNEITDLACHKIIYYNAFTEDLFYWANDLANHTKAADGTYLLEEQPNDLPFSYHLYLKSEIEKAIASGQLNKYHFNFLRNILEKTPTFLGYKNWGNLLPKTESGEHNPYEARIINISSHSKQAGEKIAIMSDDKRLLRYLMNEINQMYRFAPIKNIT